MFATRRSAIRSRLADFANVPRHEYFYELVYCLLTPQSSAVNAGRAVLALRESDLQNRAFDPEPLLHREDYYIRFHKTKAKSLLEIREKYGIVAQHLSNGSTSVELREWLVKNVRGMGWKEASHFLRNVGHRDLAILDRHILKNLVRFGVIRRIPVSLTPKRYKAIEKRFLAFARDIEISMDELDLLFWSMETGEILK
ncbi:MAG TPA: N-glycosylase/DNA lyase [Bacteroidota bacterium]|jgi:N-glycosylase/DNA lyase